VNSEEKEEAVTNEATCFHTLTMNGMLNEATTRGHGTTHLTVALCCIGIMLLSRTTTRRHGNMYLTIATYCIGEAAATTSGGAVPSTRFGDHATAGNVDPMVPVLTAACALAVVVMLMIQYGPKNSVWMQRGRMVPETRNPNDAVAIIELFRQVTVNLGREPTLAEFDEILKCRAETMFTNEWGYEPLSPNPSPVVVTDSDDDQDSDASEASDNERAALTPEQAYPTINIYGMDVPTNDIHPTITLPDTFSTPLVPEQLPVHAPPTPEHAPAMGFIDDRDTDVMLHNSDPDDSEEEEEVMELTLL
jgi:hypothetical protein